ncbi:MAG: hypothetical protein AB7S86_08315 [Hydrogenophaga sp.]|uniref:hypothetical protein n=1 Tax=Hydrogenophaga sp. TaxID=1904254 RepID=UPI003D1235C9
MNRINAHLANRIDDAWQVYFSHMGIWLAAATAGLLLMWFVSVLNDVTERGEQRRLQQRTSGTLLLPDEMKVRDLSAPIPVHGLLGRHPKGMGWKQRHSSVHS